MPVLEGVQIQNYRALRDVTLGKLRSNVGQPLPRMMTVIGANGTGKSSLLDALGFVGDCLKSGVEAACDEARRGGFERLRTRGSNEAICFKVRFRQDPDSRPIVYTLEVNADRHGRPEVVFESLKQARLGQPAIGQLYEFVKLRHGKGFVWSGESTETQEGRERHDVRMSDRQVLAISTLGTLADHPRIGAFRDFLSGWYLSYFVPDLARSKPLAGADPHLNRGGDNLARYLLFVDRQRPQELRQMLARIAAKIPGLQDITHERSNDGRLLLAFHAQGFDKPFYQEDMSDGTLKMLAYMLLMEDPTPHPLIGVEEPENGLYHQLLAPLADELKSYAGRPAGPQVLVTTHSPYFVDSLAPEDVWLLEKQADGTSRLRRASDIAGVRPLYDEGLPLGSLWYSRHLGMA
jgi:predicted ATPase